MFQEDTAEFMLLCHNRPLLATPRNLIRKASAKSASVLSISACGRTNFSEMRTNHSLTSLIQPRVKTKEHWVTFNCFDLTANHSYVLTGFLYALELDADRFGHLVNKLKDSLAKVLVPFYPMAGRVFNREGGQSALLCNDEGAIFTEAHVDAKLADAQNFDLTPISGISAALLGPGPVYVPGPSGLPALVVQVSFFSCGGVALAVNWHHQVADGYSAFHFMKSWAEVARGVEISLAPVHERSLMGPRDPPVVTIPMEKYYDIGENQLSPTPGQDTVAQSFRFSREAIAELVKVASEGRANRFTRAESMAGHIWQSIAKVRDVHPDDRIHFVSIVDGRKRFSNPSVPPGYFGNAICIARSSSIVGELLRQPLGYAADLVHKSYTGVTDEYLHSLIDWIEVQGSKNVFQGRDRVVGRDVRIVFWTHFPMFELDFGWGCPSDAGLGRGYNPRWEGTGLVMPGPRGSGGMVVRLCLQADCLTKLAMDPTFIPL